MIKEFHLDRKKVQIAYAKRSLFNWSSWVNEVCHRYIFERTIAGQTASFSAKFLEIELLKEAYYASTRPANDQVTLDPRFALLPAALQKALQFLEEHLFERIDLDRLAKAAVMSRPTLIRNFKMKLGISPIKYVWNRRLQEASQLLATGRYTIADVSGIVVYSDVSSFSHAYREYFGFYPSAQTVSSFQTTK